MPSTLKRTKKPYSYIVLDRKKRMIGGAHKLTTAMKIAGKRKNVAIAKISKAWERGKPVKSKK